MRGRAVRWTLAAAVAAGAAVVLTAGPSGAACHSFTVEVSPTEVPEGGQVTVTIRRDAALNPSSVRVRTIDVTATGGVDYTRLDERVSFTTETTQTRTIGIADDRDHEGPETFTVQLSEGEGCPINPRFSYGSPVTVTILDDDPSPSPSPPATATPTPTEATTEPSPTTPAPAPTRTLPTPTTDTTGSPLAAPTTSPTAAPPPAAPSGSRAPVAALAVAVVSALGAAGVAWWLRRG